MATKLNFSNVELWNALRKKYKSFASLTADATADLFSEKGWGDISRDNIPALNSFFELSMRVAFQKMDIAKVNTRLVESGLVEVYGTENGGYLQRISMETITPVSPAFINLQNGDSPDPFVVRKPDNAKERFFTMNFGFQSLVSIQEYTVKTVFLDEYGMSSFLGGIMASLENGYKYQLELNVYKCIHECINSQTHPLQDTQKIELDSWTDAGVTDAELLALIGNLQDLATSMETSITQKGFNANKFDTAVSPEDHVVLLRAGIANKIKRQLMVGAYNPDNLTIPFKIIEVQDFGGVQHYAKISNVETLLYPHYDDKLGAVDGWATSEGGDKAYELDAEAVYTVDADADVLAVVAQKGLIFENIKDPYQVVPIFSPRGLYTNYWASAPDTNTIAYDANYDCIEILKPQS